MSAEANSPPVFQDTHCDVLNSGISIVLPAESLACNLEFGIPVIRSATADRALVISHNDRIYTRREYPLSTTCYNPPKRTDSGITEHEDKQIHEEEDKFSSDEPFSEFSAVHIDPSPRDASKGDSILPEYIAKFIRAAKQNETEHPYCTKSNTQASPEYVLQSSIVTTGAHLSNSSCEHGENDASALDSLSIKRNLATYTTKDEPELAQHIANGICASKRKEHFPLHGSQTDGVDGVDKSFGEIRQREEREEKEKFKNPSSRKDKKWRKDHGRQKWRSRMKMPMR